jgi:hypothetical protein
MIRMSLQSKLDAFKADFGAGKPRYNVPRAVIETMIEGLGATLLAISQQTHANGRKSLGVQSRQAYGCLRRRRAS